MNVFLNSLNDQVFTVRRLKTRSVKVILKKSGRAVEVAEGQKIPAEAEIIVRKYQIEMPDEDYQKLNVEARQQGVNIGELIKSKYKQIDKLPQNWVATEI